MRDGPDLYAHGTIISAARPLALRGRARLEPMPTGTPPLIRFGLRFAAVLAMLGLLFIAWGGLA